MSAVAENSKPIECEHEWKVLSNGHELCAKCSASPPNPMNHHTTPSKLDVIYYEHLGENIDEFKQQIKELVLEIIGDNEFGNIGYVGEDMVDDTSEEMHIRNQLRQEQRERIKGL